MDMNTLAELKVKTLRDMPAHARVWVYKTARDLGQAEQKMIREHGALFTTTWAAHGAALDACVDVLEDRFVVVAVDEVQALASGCSIDKSVGFIKQLEMDLNLMLTASHGRGVRARWRDPQHALARTPGLIAEGEFTLDTIVFDDLVSTVGELRERFRVRLADSWMNRFLS
ncbi:MAG: hypothetical protein IPK99_16640 [Flavobacteriales bacterium]|nr:hypothetical protein [Flavobacteriales bacterium]